MNIMCAGPHATPVIVGVSDASTQDYGMLCELCGTVYATGVSDNTLEPGTIPDSDKIAKVLTSLKITYDKTKYKAPKGTS